MNLSSIINRTRRYCILFLAGGLAAGYVGSGLNAQELPTPGTVQEQFKQQSPRPTKGTSPDIDQQRQRNPAAVPSGGKAILIDRFEISGNTVVTDQEMDAIVSTYEGRSLTLLEIYEVADELTKYYRDKGYSVATVTVPAQKVSSGIVLLEVIEGRIGAVEIAGNPIYKDHTIKGQVTNIQPGAIISEQYLERDLLRLNDLPGLTAKAVVKPGETFGDSDLVIQTGGFQGSCRLKVKITPPYLS